MFCSCGRRRPLVAPMDESPVATKSPMPFITQITGFTPEPLMLTIRVPKRTRWAPYDEAHKNLFMEKVAKSLAHAQRLPIGEARFRGTIILFNDIIAQPLCLASAPKFREVCLTKMEEMEGYMKNHPETRYEDEFCETSYQWHELLTELHDHPLYKED
jgi:hypothetical protein